MRAWPNLRKLDSPKVYVRSLQTMALAEARNAVDIGLLIKKNVEWLLQARVYKGGRFIGWEYENRGTAMSSDASNSQYAMLALWYARQAGIPIQREVWEGIRDYYTRTQFDKGYWIYSADYAPRGEEKTPSVTMTVAGLCGLLIAGMELNGGREQLLPNGAFKNCGIYDENAPAAKAQQWINNNFKLDLADRTYYHLYGLERAGRLSGQRFFGEHDWYREGCEFLTKNQQADGSWPTKGGWDRWPLVNTSFALLFLSKGRTPVLMSKLVHGNWPRAEWDLDWNNDRNDLRHLTEQVAKSELFGKKPLAWQTYDVMRSLYARSDSPTKADEDAIVADMLQSPILYITGHKSPLRRIQNRENALIKRYVESGGFLFAEACCGDPLFDAGIKEWVKENWEGSELTYLESTHPVWTCFEKVQAGEPYKLMGLQVGCRTIMLYSPQDLSCYWESGLPSPPGRGVGGEGDGRRHLAFRLGGNIVAYATGKTPPLPRLTEIAIANERPMVTPTKRGFFQAGQIYHKGDWQPAPKAMTNLLGHVHKLTGLDVMPKAERIRVTDKNSVIQSKFLYMHGRNPIGLKADELEHLKFTLENGGLLFADACCGNEVFDQSFRKFVQDLFPKEKLLRIPADDRFFGAELNELNGGVLTAGNIKCRIKASGPMLPMEPYLEGIQVNGRWIVVYSKYDIGCALESKTTGDCVGYDPASAMRIATAAVLYNVRP